MSHTSATDNQPVTGSHLAVCIQKRSVDMWLLSVTNSMDRMVVNGNTFSQTQAPFCVSDVLVDEDNHCVGVDVILLGDRKIPKDLGNVEIVKSDTDFHFSILFNSKTKREIVGMQSINNAFFEDQFGNWLMVIEVGEFGKTISNQLKRIGSSHTVI